MSVTSDYLIAVAFGRLWAWCEGLPTQGTLGLRGERLASRYLRRLGYLILENQARDRMGEADLVAFAHDSLIFVEVKTRRSSQRGKPEEAVNPDKRRRLLRFAERYVSRYGLERMKVRFDVIAVDWPATGLPKLRHHIAAFTLDDP